MKKFLAVILAMAMVFALAAAASADYTAEEEAEAAKGAAKRLGGSVPEMTVFSLPGADGETLGRSLVRIVKTAPTPKQYPRKAGTAAKSPLS